MPAATRHLSTTPPPVTSGGNSPARKATNLTLAVGLVAEARALGINVSQAAELGIAAAVARLRQEQWLAENQAALDSSNAFVEQHGLPLAQYRNF
ncbi:MAG: type II toxin-antitoxin system CcdA family antitoxin [Burkholderiaceae bacterium]|nr:type II toxin-antitoxin system CcdA family antitoxin [Roseateles sp.]MBV8470461.1 type II toxin-antitoxin system CcdA family antitoxin [Burkholderiaceae bacterium]